MVNYAAPVGVLERVGRWFRQDTLTAAEPYRLTSWGGDVSQVANLPSSVAEAFGINVSSDVVTRKEAMTVPAVRRGRAVIAGTIGSAGLVAIRERAGNPPERVTRQILTQPDRNVTRSWQLTWTVDSMMFYGLGWWRVTERGADKLPARGEWVANYRVSITPGGTVLVDNQEVPDRDLIRFDGPDEGLLTTSARALRTYILLEEAVRKFARLDVPLGWFEDQVGAMDETEVKTYLDAWEAARKSRTTGYVPQGMKYNLSPWSAGQLQLSEARGFQAAEIARALNLPAVYVNAPTGDSLTYATTESNRRELVDISLAPFITAIEQRLSMPDVTPIGTTVHVDLGKFLRGDLKSVLEAGEIAVRAGLMDADEVRTDWLNLPPRNQEASSGTQDPQDAQDSGAQPGG